MSQDKLRAATAAHVADAMTLAQVLRIAAAQFVRQARHGSDPTKFRIDLYRKVDVPDRAVAILGRDHAVAVRLSITCESMLFEEGDTTSVTLPAPAPDTWRG